MGISHIALAVKDLEATHRFYTDVMGFDLVKVEIADMRGGAWGWLRVLATPSLGTICFIAWWLFARAEARAKAQEDMMERMAVSSGIIDEQMHHALSRSLSVDDVAGWGSSAERAEARVAKEARG